MVLQKRISLALTAVIAVFVTVQGYLAYRSLEKQEDSLVDEVVQTEAERLRERLQAREVVLDSATQPLRLGPNLQAWLAPARSGGGEVAKDPAHPVDSLHALSSEAPAEVEPVQLAQCGDEVWEARQTNPWIEAPCIDAPGTEEPTAALLSRAASGPR